MKSKLNNYRIPGLMLAALLFTASLASFGTNAPITTAATISTAVPGQPVIVPVTVTGFNNINGFYLSMDYEYAKLHYVTSVSNAALSGFLSVGDIDLGTGIHRLTISWVGNSGLTLADGSWLVKYTFTFISGPAPLQWFDIGPSCEYTMPPSTILNDSPTSTYYINGLVYQSLPLNTKVFLEGAYSGGSMNTTLRSLGVLPLSQPYNVSPWNYSGTEQVASVPAGVTDWVLVELRTGQGAATKVGTRAGFLKSNGAITDLDGSSYLSFPGISAGNYYIVIRHRNHMPVMSASAVALSSSGTLYDFTTGSSQVYGGANGYKNIDPILAKWGMVAGDASNEGSIFIDDYTDYWVPSFGLLNAYNRSDFNLDGNVFINDYTDLWVPNFGKSNVLP
ncbi:MAG: hypothetical protein HXX13_00015 [Bacteroidetes bacterium]|nr:hypothetical protein [Bacteroidota bacterium]